MTPLQTWLNELHPAHAIVDVIVDVIADVHECGYGAGCTVCHEYIIQYTEHQLLDRHFTAPVAQIVVLAKGYDHRGEILGGDGPESWPYVCEECINEARDIMLTHDIAPVVGWITVMEDDDERATAIQLIDNLQA